MPDRHLRVETRELNWAPGHGFASAHRGRRGGPGALARLPRAALQSGGVRGALTPFAAPGGLPPCQPLAGLTPLTDGLPEKRFPSVFIMKTSYIRPQMKRGRRSEQTCSQQIAASRTRRGRATLFPKGC